MSVGEDERQRAGGSGRGPQVLRWLFDAVLAGVAVQLALALTAEIAPPGPARGWLLALAAAHAAPLIVRRRFPVGVLATGIVTGLAYALFAPVLMLGPAMLVAMYTVGARCDRRTSLRALAAAEAGLVVGLALPSWPGDLLSWVAFTALLAGAWLLGDIVHRRQVAEAAAEAHAAEVERAQQQLADRAVMQERVRIARELHDVVAHSMSVIALQSGTGRLVIDTRPDQAREALVQIERTSRATLVELRHLVSVLRQPGDPSDGLAPAPGIGDIDALVAKVVTSGVTVDVQVEGTRRPLPPGLGLSVYRMVQEALTNVLKHAGPATATVVIRYIDTGVAIEITDTGRGTGAAPTGYGTIGMRERAALYGGTLQAGPLPEGGYRVAATLSYAQP